MSPRRFPSSEEGVEEVMSVLLIFVIFAIGAGVILGAGYPLMETAKNNAHMQQVEQAFTGLDSRLSKAALGEAPSQAVRLSLGDGGLSIVNTTWINISLRNGTTISDCINVSLNTLEYKLNQRTVAWEGGGVWAKYPSGASVMLSPPEFHYSGVTLTMPLINLSGSISAGGRGTVTLYVNSSNTPNILYPGASVFSPCGNTNHNRANPLGGSNISLLLQSDYYQAWADFFNRSDLVNVSVTPATKQVRVNLTLQPSDKDDAPFQLPIAIPCINTSSCTPLPAFKVFLAGRDVPSCGTLTVDLRSPNKDSGADNHGGTTGLHIQISRDGGNGAQPVRVSVDWKDQNGSKELWGSQQVATLDCNPTDSSTVDLLTTTNEGYGRTVYSGGSSDNTVTWGNSCDLNPGTTSSWMVNAPFPPTNGSKFCYDGQGGVATGCEDGKSSNNVRNTPPIGYIVQHYLLRHYSQIGALNFQCTQNNDKCPGNSNSLSAASTYTIHYDCSNSLTYLHITENRLNVTAS